KILLSSKIFREPLRSIPSTCPFSAPSAPRAVLRFALRARSGLKPRPTSLWSRLRGCIGRRYGVVAWETEQSSTTLVSPEDTFLARIRAGWKLEPAEEMCQEFDSRDWLQSLLLEP